MKALVLNASPRKTGNTAKLLKSAADGARDVGAEVEYINLYELIFTGCRGCMLCKRKGVERCHCYWKDDLSPIIDKIFHADVLLIGTAIYLGRFVSMNATKEFYDRLYKAKFEEYAKEWEMLGDKVILYPCYDTLQVSDYSKFNMASFDESKKKLAHEKNFPKDLENAYRIGQELCKYRTSTDY